LFRDTMISDQTLRCFMPPRTVALVGDVIRALLWAALIALAAIFVPIYGRIWRQTLNQPGISDFTIFYYTARMVADGLPMYGASPATYGVHWATGHLGNLNPPHFQLLLQPLAQLTYGQAYVVWTGLNVVALLIALIAILRELGTTVTLPRAAAWGVLTMASVPFTSVALTSEWSFGLLVPFTLAWTAARRGRWRRTGAWLGTCVAFKLFFLLFVAWLVVRRRWAALGAAGAVTAGWIAIGVLECGSDTYALWARSLGRIAWWWLPMNASWSGAVSRVLAGGEGFQAVFTLPWLVRPASLFGSSLIAAGSVWAAVRLERHRNGADAAILVLLAGAILASPLGWVYYLPLALGPLAAVLGTSWWTHVPVRWAVAACVAALALYTPVEQTAAGQPSSVATASYACAYFWGLSVGWAALVRTAAAPADPAELAAACPVGDPRRAGA
jgi:alpha-1,2-mannosyltransferase